jgi:nitrogen regulatory protein P-II 1
MKLIIAFLRPEQLPAVKQALFDAQIRHFTAMMVLGTAPKTEQQMYRGELREISLFKRVRLEVVVKEAQVETAISAISAGSKESGGWGRIVVASLDDMVKIWTGERGNLAY